MADLPESDWKKIRDMADEVLSRACEQIFEKVEKISNNRNGREHKAYIKLYKLIKKEDYEIGQMFNDLKRSNAILKLAFWKRRGLISDEEFGRLSEKTRERAILLLGESDSKRPV